MLISAAYSSRPDEMRCVAGCWAYAWPPSSVIDLWLSDCWAWIAGNGSMCVGVWQSDAMGLRWFVDWTGFVAIVPWRDWPEVQNE